MEVNAYLAIFFIVQWRLHANVHELDSSNYIWKSPYHCKLCFNFVLINCQVQGFDLPC